MSLIVCRPCGTWKLRSLFYPALKGWAIFCCPAGTGADFELSAQVIEGVLHGGECQREILRRCFGFEDGDELFKTPEPPINAERALLVQVRAIRVAKLPRFGGRQCGMDGAVGGQFP